MNFESLIKKKATDFHCCFFYSPLFHKSSILSFFLLCVPAVPSGFPLYLFPLRSKRMPLQSLTRRVKKGAAHLLMQGCVNEPAQYKTEKPQRYAEASVMGWRRPTFPHTCSIIGAAGLNFSVRNGKRWTSAL